MTTIGLTLPQLGSVVDAGLVKDFVQQAEFMGFGSLWVQDHFLYALTQTGEYGGSATTQPEAYRSVLAPTELLAAAAAWTSTAALGTSILVGGNHWPAQLANRLATVDALSGGRLSTVGLSVGWSEEEHRAVGVDPRTRGKRMDDFVPALKACWGDDPVEYRGSFFDIGPAVMQPKPARVPKFMSGMYSEAGLARTVRDFDLWNPGSIPIDKVVSALDSMNSTRPVGKAPLGAVYRLAQQSTSGTRLTVADMCTRVEECVQANLDGIIVETNFCSEIDSPASWMKILAELEPLVTASRG